MQPASLPRATLAIRYADPAAASGSQDHLRTLQAPSHDPAQPFNLDELDEVDFDAAIAAFHFDAPPESYDDEKLLSLYFEGPTVQEIVAKRPRTGPAESDLGVDLPIISRFGSPEERAQAIADLTQAAARHRDSREHVDPEQVLDLRTRYLRVFAEEWLSAEEACALIDAHLPAASEHAEEPGLFDLEVAELELNPSAPDYGCKHNTKKLHAFYPKLWCDAEDRGKYRLLSPGSMRTLLRHTTLYVLCADEPAELHWYFMHQALKSPTITWPPDLVHLMLGRLFAPMVDQSTTEAKRSMCEDVVSTAVEFKLTLDAASSARFADECLALLQPGHEPNPAAALHDRRRIVTATLQALRRGILQLDPVRRAAVDEKLLHALSSIFEESSKIGAYGPISGVVDETLKAIDANVLAVIPDRIGPIIARMIDRTAAAVHAEADASPQVIEEERRLARFALHDSLSANPQLPTYSLQRLVRLSERLISGFGAPQHALDATQAEVLTLLSNVILQRPGVLYSFDDDAQRFASVALTALQGPRLTSPQKAIALAALGRIMQTSANMNISNSVAEFIVTTGTAAFPHAPSPDVAAALRQTIDLFTRQHGSSTPSVAPAAVAVTTIERRHPPLLAELERRFRERTWDPQLDEQLDGQGAQHAATLTAAVDFAAHGVATARPDAWPVSESVIRFVHSELAAGRRHPELLAKTIHMLKTRVRKIDAASSRAINRLALAMFDSRAARKQIVELLCSMAFLSEKLEPIERSRRFQYIAGLLFVQDTGTTQRLKLVRLLLDGTREATAPVELREPYATLANPLALFETRRTQFFAALENSEESDVRIPLKLQRLFVENLALLMADDRQTTAQRREEHLDAFATLFTQPRMRFTHAAVFAFVKQALKISASSPLYSRRAEVALSALVILAERMPIITGQVMDQTMPLLESTAARQRLTELESRAELQKIRDSGTFERNLDRERLNALLETIAIPSATGSASGLAKNIP